VCVSWTIKCWTYIAVTLYHKQSRVRFQRVELADDADI